MTFHVSAIKYTAMDVHFISGVVDRMDFFLNHLFSYTRLGKSTANHCFRHTIAEGLGNILHGKHLIYNNNLYLH